MEMHQHRVVNEKAELDCRLHALADFMGLNIFRALTLQEQDRLHRQLRAMREYSSILAERIAAF